MYFRRITTPGLAHFSYLLGSGAEAVVIDPRRDVDVYLDACRAEGFHVAHVCETHRHEDFVSGSLELEKVVPGTRVWRGNDLPYVHGTELADGQVIKFGTARLEARHTPGHTRGHFAFVAFDAESGTRPLYLFSGDALFAGDTGRTDFYGTDHEAEMAGLLHDSLHEKLLPLGDDVVLCPAHGAGSVCGTQIADRVPTTIGLEKALTPALGLSRAEFVEQKVAEVHGSPPYFRKMEEWNLGTAPLLATREHAGPLTPPQVDALRERGATVLDLRTPPAFAGAHVPGSLCVVMFRLAALAGWFLPYDRPVVLVPGSTADVPRALTILARLGYDNVAGYLHPGLVSWYASARPVASLALMTVGELKDRQEAGESLHLLDVRSRSAWDQGHLPGARHVPFEQLTTSVPALSKEHPVVIYCTVGFRATIVASLFAKAGYANVYVVLGSYRAWQAAGYPVEQPD